MARETLAQDMAFRVALAHALGALQTAQHEMFKASTTALEMAEGGFVSGERIAGTIEGYTQVLTDIEKRVALQIEHMADRRERAEDYVAELRKAQAR